MTGKQSSIAGLLGSLDLGRLCTRPPSPSQYIPSLESIQRALAARAVTATIALLRKIEGAQNASTCMGGWQHEASQDGWNSATEATKTCTLKEHMMKLFTRSSYDEGTQLERGREAIRKPT